MKALLRISWIDMRRTRIDPPSSASSEEVLPRGTTALLPLPPSVPLSPDLGRAGCACTSTATYEEMIMMTDVSEQLKLP